jgi:small subunit ribosomal protein S16
MALKIRLRRMGRKKAPHYRIVVAENTMPRDGRFVARLGYYNPTTDPTTLKVDRNAAREWLERGAVPTVTVQNLMKSAGVYDDTLESAGEAVAAGAAEVREATGDVASSTAEAAGAVAERVVEVAGDVADGVVEAASAVAEAVTEAVGADDSGEPTTEP